MTSHDFTIYNTDLYIKFYSESLNYRILNELQRPFKHSIDYYEKENKFDNQEIDNPIIAFSFDIPETLKKLGLVNVVLKNRLLSINYKEDKLEIIIDLLDYEKTCDNLKFECSKYSVDEEVQNFLESLIYDDRNWNFIFSLIDSNKVIELLEGGISELFDTKRMVKEHES